MSALDKDFHENEGTSLQSKGPSVTTYDSTESKRKASILDSNASKDLVHSRSERVGNSSTTPGPERLHGLCDTYEHAPAPYVDSRSASMGYGAGADCLPAPFVAISQPRRSSKQAAEQGTLDAPPSHSMGGKSGGLNPLYRRISANTESGPMTNDRENHETPNDLEDLQSPAIPKSENNSTKNAKPSSSKARRARQVSTSWRWASIICFIILGLVVVGIAIACVADWQSQSVRIEKGIGLASRACLGVSSAYAWILYTVNQHYQSLPPLQALRPSSRRELGSGLGDTYTSLSQALVARNSLYKAPELVRQKRGEAMRFQLPDDSLISEHLQLFLRQSICVDDDLLKLVHRTTQMATLALRQHHHTQETLRSIQRIQYWGTFEPLRISLVGTSTQEAQLQTRLKEHVELLQEKIVVVDYATREVLQQFIGLTFTTENIRESSLQDQQRLLLIKEETASHRDWAIRAAMQLLRMPEPEDLVEISRNVKLAQNIHNWTTGVVELLEHMTTHLTYAKIQIGSLIDILSTDGTVKWGKDNKDYELLEFLAQISDGFILLENNTAAWNQIQLSGRV